MKRTFRALTTIASVAIDDDLPSAALAALAIEGYPDAEGTPELAYELRGGASPRLVYDDGRSDPRRDPRDLVPLLELDLYTEVARRARPGWLLHAAALVHRDRAFVLAGPSGAGKTTLTFALVARGWRVMTEEMVLVDRELVVHGLARPLHVPPATEQHAAIPADWRQLPYEIREEHGIRRDTLVQPPVAIRHTDPAPLHALIRIGHGPERPPALERLRGSQALSRLWDATLRPDPATLAAAGVIVATAACYELHSSSVAEAVALIESI